MKEEARKAPRGERTIRLTVAFWTNNIAEGEGNIVPKHAWSYGKISLNAKTAHGIKASEPIAFESLMELPAKLEQLLIREGITLHVGRNMGKYIQQNDDQIQQRIEEILTGREGPVVYATTGTLGCYHYKGCHHIEGKDNVVPTRRKLLDELGYELCEDCKIDE